VYENVISLKEDIIIHKYQPFVRTDTNNHRFMISFSVDSVRPAKHTRSLREMEHFDLP
jgi:hypothetical protein